MARTTSVPPHQLAGLKNIYNQQRDALVALARAEDAVAAAEQTVASAKQDLKDAQTNANTAYQALVELMGAALAADLTGRRRPNGKRVTTSTSTEHRDGREQQRTEPVSDAESAS